MKHTNTRKLNKQKRLKKKRLTKKIKKGGNVEKIWTSIDVLNLKCPITKSIMYDPVIAEDGITYERSNIEKWFRTKQNQTSPSTNLEIGTQLISNLAIRDINHNIIKIYDDIINASQTKNDIVIKNNFWTNSKEICDNGKNKKYFNINILKELKESNDINILKELNDIKLLKTLDKEFYAEKRKNNIDVNIDVNKIFDFSKNGDINQIKLLINNKGADVVINLTNKLNMTPLYIACEHGHDDVVDLLLNNGAAVDIAEMHGQKTPLHISCLKNNFNIVLKLILKGADVNKASEDGSTPLFFACFSDNNGVVPRMLLHNHANINQPRHDGMTPLFVACAKRNNMLVQMLLNNGANANQADELGQTPVHAAVYNNDVEMIKLLLENGANINKADNAGNTPLEVAKSNSADAAVIKLIQTHSVASS